MLRKYQEDVDTLNAEAEFSSKRTSVMKDMCGILFDLAVQSGRKRSKRMLPNFQNSSFDLVLFRTTVNTLKDYEDVLKRGAEKVFKMVGSKRHVIQMEEDFDNMEVVIYGINAVDALKRPLSLAIADECMSFRPCGEDWKGKNRNQRMKSSALLNYTRG